MLTSTGNRKSSCCSLVAGRPYEADTKACCDKQAGWRRYHAPHVKRKLSALTPCPTSAHSDEKPLKFPRTVPRKTYLLQDTSHSEVKPLHYIHIKIKILVSVSVKMNANRPKKAVQFERPVIPMGRRWKGEGLPGNLSCSQLESNLIGLMYSHYSGKTPFGSSVCLHTACLFPKRVQIQCV